MLRQARFPILARIKILQIMGYLFHRAPSRVAAPLARLLRDASFVSRARNEIRESADATIRLATSS